MGREIWIQKNFVEYIRKKSNFWGGLKKVRRIRILEQLTLKGIRMILLFDLSGKSSIKVCQIVQIQSTIQKSDLQNTQYEDDL